MNLLLKAKSERKAGMTSGYTQDWLIKRHEEMLEACKLAFKRLKPGNIRKDFDSHIAKAALGTAIYNAEGRD